jgi:hypothetical protein
MFKMPNPQELFRTFVHSLVQRGVWMMPKWLVLVLIVVVVILSFVMNK